MATPYSSYAQVPWHRKNWFAFICLFVCPPGVLINILTGDIYYEENDKLKTYSKAAKVFIFLWFGWAMYTVIRASAAGEGIHILTLALWCILSAALYVVRILPEKNGAQEPK